MNAAINHTPVLDASIVLGEIAAILRRTDVLEERELAGTDTAADAATLDALFERRMTLETLLPPMPATSPADALGMITVAAGQMTFLLASEPDDNTIIVQQRVYDLLASAARCLAATLPTGDVAPVAPILKRYAAAS